MKETVSVPRELLERVRNIMAFHSSRCDMHPLSNGSGLEEHCSEYRAVFDNVKQALMREPAPVPYDKHEREMLEVIDQRDKYHDEADKLANAIAEYFDADIGEHSSANCPWENALEEIQARRKPVEPTEQAGDVGDRNDPA